MSEIKEDIKITDDTNNDTNNDIKHSLPSIESDKCNDTIKYTYMQTIEKLVNKKLLFLDLETTGFPRRSDKSMPGKYADYKNNKCYNSSRILQIGWYYCDNFIKDVFAHNLDDIKSIIRKPSTFKIPKSSTEIHSITYEKALKEGVTIKNILNGEFGECFMKCDYIVGYNVYFDFSILANEIHRDNNKKLYDKILELKDNNVVCMMRLCRDYTQINMSQGDAYKYLYKQMPIKQHDAKNDVHIMLEILRYVLNNPPPPKITKKKSYDDKPSNNGSLWSNEEQDKLKNAYLNENKSVDELATIHKRTIGGILSRLKKMDVLKDSDKERIVVVIKNKNNKNE